MGGKRRDKSKKSTATAYELRLVGSALADVRLIRAIHRRAVLDHLDDLRRRGCKAAGYALTGDAPWPKICSTHVGAYRVLVTFPEDGVVAVLKIAEHTDRSDPYRDLAEELGVPTGSGERTKPPCCTGESDPIDPTVAAQLEDAFSRLTRGGRKERSTSARKRRPPIAPPRRGKA